MENEDLRRRVKDYVEQADEKLLQLMESVAATYHKQDLTSEEVNDVEQNLKETRKDQLIPHERVTKMFKKRH